MATVSVIICTRDRAESLRETLVSLAGVALPPGVNAEVLVVDNGSTDHTRAVAESAPRSELAVRYVYEPRKGQCYARNAGLRESGGEVILFTDDDVRVPGDWIARMSAPILAGEAEMVSGGIRLAPHLSRPWLTEDHRNWLAGYEGPKTGGEIWVIGANMGFARRVLERVPGFDEELGPGQLGFADEALFSRQAAAAGFRTVFVAGAEVEHHFDPSRLTRESLLKMAVAKGRSNAYVHHHWSHGRVPFPRLKILQLRAMLLWLGRRGDRGGGEGISRLEMGLRGYLAYCEAYLGERRRKRNYDHRGLVKRAHLRDTCQR